MYAPRGASVTILTLLAVSSSFKFGTDSDDDEKILALITEQTAPRPSQGLAPRRLADSGPVSARSEQPAPAQRLTFEAAKAAQSDRRTGTHNSTYFDTRAPAAVRRLEVPM